MFVSHHLVLGFCDSCSFLMCPVQ